MSQTDARPFDCFHVSGPFDEMVPLKFSKNGHRLVYASQDLPLVVSRGRADIAMWGVEVVETRGEDRVAGVRKGGCDVVDDPIAAFVNGAAAMAAVEGGNFGEEPLPPPREIRLRLLYEMPAEECDRVDVFLAHDLRGRLVLCVCVGGELTGLSFSVSGMQVSDMVPSFRILDVASAVPVFAVRRHQRCLDVLARHGSGGMSLFMGRNRLCSVELGDVPAKVGGHCDQELIVTEGVGSQFSLVDRRGFAVRYSLSSSTFSSPLVNACMNAISFTFENAGIMLRITTLYQNILTACAGRGNDFVDDADDHDWTVFKKALMESAATTHEQSLNDRMDTDSETESDQQNRGCEEDWLWLLSSGHHRRRSKSRSLGPPPVYSRTLRDEKNVHDVNGSDMEFLRHVLQALHLVYEEHKLHPLLRSNACMLAELNLLLAGAMGASSFIDHYKRDYAYELVGIDDMDLSGQFGTDLYPVPSLLDYLTVMVRGEAYPSASYPLLQSSCLVQTQYLELMASWRAESPAELSARVVRYFQCLYSGESDITYEARAESALLAMVEDGFSRVDLEALPFGVAIPLQDALISCRQNPKPSWPYRAFVLIGREDLFDFNSLETKTVTPSHPDVELVNEDRSLLQIQAAAASLTQSAGMWLPDGASNNGSTDEGGDGCDMHARIFQLRFSSDRRTDEVRRILRSTDPVVMTPLVSPNDSNFDFDAAAEQKRKLEVLVRKRYASPVGRGAYTLRTFVPSDPTKPLSVPEICTTGVLFAHEGSKVTYTPADPTRLQWGEFHNGVAAGLRIAAASDDKDGESGEILTRSWIVNHRPLDESATNHHAGMLLALGLGGHLPTLRTTDYYKYLLARHELTSIGLMLGLATGNMGSMHEKVMKMLCLHIKYFNGPGFAVPDFHVPVTVQTASILGLGFLHKGSCEHLIIDGLFTELGRQPRPGDNVDGREGLALAAGVSIGLVCLGNGTAAFDAADKRLIDRLVQYANGGPRDSLETVSSNLENIQIKSDFGGQERSAMSLGDSEASCVKEGDFVNSDVVSPGSLLALALIYLKTNDNRIAKRIIIPDTLYALDRSRPDHVFLRVLARALIMWDDISASRSWVLEKLPPLLRPREVDNGAQNIDILGKIILNGTHSELDVDVPGIIHARAFAIAGACAAIALKYAGTNDASAVSILLGQCESFENALLKQDKDEESAAWVFMTCLSSAALSLAVVAAGSGNLDVFRLLRRVRKRRCHSITNGRYGYHLAVHQAVGFLFLGGGCQTFGTSNIAIAGLLCAIYPRFPENIDDNCCHLQAMRHLYVLAVEPRYIETRDVDTGVPCCVDVEICLANGALLKSTAPCIVPEARSIQDISVVSERYWETKVHINAAVPGSGWYSRTKGQVFFVKRRTGHLPYSSDPKGSKGIMARSICRPKPMMKNLNTYFTQVDDLVRAFSADADVLAFVKYFCSPSGHSLGADGLKDANEQAKAHVEMLYECLSSDKPEAVRIYMNAELATAAVLKGGADPSTVGSLMIASAYILADQGSRIPLLHPTYLTKLLHTIFEALDYKEVRQALLKYVWSIGKTWPEENNSSSENRNVLSDFATLLRLQGIPSTNRLSGLQSSLKRACSANVKAEESWPYFSNAFVGGLWDNAVTSIIYAAERDAV